jgi:hypothetical protein
MLSDRLAIQTWRPHALHFFPGQATLQLVVNIFLVTCTSKMPTFSSSQISCIEKHSQGMHVKSYKLRGLTLKNGKQATIEMDLEFEGKRAFAVWDSISLGAYELKARVELNPKLLKKDTSLCCDFVYRGELVLPRPENN